ncbi:hypothetical protein VIBNIWn13_360001 [Vibrio nigripulchritudo Wn13]|nr:hypothetical protein VIBNIBLFn1_560001 [Vibrio nigripulchritudo BLFn1]CCO42703.1 hypothetical protein VIBNISFn135_840001 [Vibrio nigripulchritudo SFn135]CCO52569.1 hypothetical protein VIBNIWn13_360001 [Vibrio nigripulchritudo Wn13]
MGQKISSQRASLFGFHAEPTILGWFEYKIIFGLNSTRYVLSHDPDSNLIHLGIRNKRDI